MLFSWNRCDATQCALIHFAPSLICVHFCVRLGSVGRSLLLRSFLLRNTLLNKIRASFRFRCTDVSGWALQERELSCCRFCFPLVSAPASFYLFASDPFWHFLHFRLHLMHDHRSCDIRCIVRAQISHYFIVISFSTCELLTHSCLSFHLRHLGTSGESFCILHRIHFSLIVCHVSKISFVSCISLLTRCILHFRI